MDPRFQVGSTHAQLPFNQHEFVEAIKEIYFYECDLDEKEFLQFEALLEKNPDKLTIETFEAWIQTAENSEGLPLSLSFSGSPYRVKPENVRELIHDIVRDISID